MLHGQSQPACRTALGRRRKPTAAGTLSRRQREVLELLANGIPAREIAVRLGLAETTVRNHIRHLLRKLGCHSQLEAVAVAFRLDLLDRTRESASAAPRLGVGDRGTPPGSVAES